MWVAALLLGTILGSFLNALSFRFNTGVSIMHGRSRCMRCGHTLGVLDLIPLVSYLMLGGRCRYCGTRISLQYPLVEASAALLSLGVYLEHPSPLPYAVWLLWWLTALFIVVYDTRHTVIPWSASGMLLGLSLATLFFLPPGVQQLHLVAGVYLALPLLLVFLLSRGQWMGLGDSGLELSLGWMLGPMVGLTAFMLGIWSGALVGIVLLWSRSGVTMKSEIPLAPFLVLGAALAYFLHVDFFSTILSIL